MADMDVSSEIDPDGAMGVIAAPTWSARWSGLNLNDLEACFKNAAECAALSLNQMEQLLQGLPPERSTWPHLRTCLSGCKVAIRDLRFDLANETLPRPVSPSQFLAWCADRQHELPDPFIERLMELESISVSHQGAPKNVMTASIWGQLVASVPAATPKPRKAVSGRPKTAALRDKQLVAAGNQILMASAEKGIVMTRDAVAAELERSGVAGGIALDTIKRVLSGQLYLEQARQVAHVRAKGGGD